LNSVQNRIELKVANLSAPLDAFTVREGKRFLWKERVAERLSGTAGELGANVVFCPTRYLNPDDGAPVYAWWPKDLESAMLVFFYAGIVLDPDSLETARALANAVVRAVATEQRLVLHDAAPEDWPMLSNKAGSPATIKAGQSFDTQCRNRFSEPEYLEALDALLRCFDESPAAAPRARRARKRRHS
jgi:hypothetical protein